MAAKHFCRYGVLLDNLSACPLNPDIACAIVCPWRYNEKSGKNLDKVNRSIQQQLPLPQFERIHAAAPAQPGLMQAAGSATGCASPNPITPVQGQQQTAGAMLHTEHCKAMIHLERGPVPKESVPAVAAKKSAETTQTPRSRQAKAGQPKNVQLMEMFDGPALQKFLGLTPSTFARYVREGKLPEPNIRFSQKRRYWSREYIETWLKNIWRKN